MATIELFSFTQNMSSATVVEWHVEDGATVAPGDDLVEVESEKAVQVIPAPVGGVVSIEIPAGVQVDVGTTLATIQEEATGTSGPSASSEDTHNGPTPAVRRVDGKSLDGESERIRASPAARHLAREHSVALGDLAGEGAGPGGAIVERDVVRVIDAESAGGESVEGRAIAERREAGELRRAVAEQMTTSARDIPQVTLHRSVPAEAALDLKDRIASDLDVDLSIEDFVVGAAALALDEHADFNAIYADGSHQLARNVNIGIAVDVDRGLLTPVVRSAAQRGLIELHRERRELVNRVRTGEYSMDDLADGTFTVTNLGGFGVERFDPLINPPEVAILGIGAVSATLDSETREPVKHLPLSLTFDHRPNDGADAARFLDAIAEGLQHPLRLLETRT